LQPAGRQQDANLIWLVTSRMQLLMNLGILYCKAASQMQFASGWWLTE
jgi:hypothetical protein